ncbi:MAG: right-handed parallel beta-helix repeat-containing protein, partial [Planctomycetaceae bacterium]|nr:right-handed parallel beta-helix repeat-containing protein [Planctomycetaceae bacterium]
ELWKSDGTEAGTVLVKDIYASGNVGSEVDELVNLNGTLYFRARGTSITTRTNIWKSDGTEAGTVPVTDIGYTTDSSNISNLTNVNGTIYFRSTDEHGKELWALDATGAFLVKDLLPGSASPTITDITSLGGILYFVTNDYQSGNELWRSDGTAQGTYAIDAVQPGGAYPQNLRVAGNKLIYSALSDAYGRELFLYDPTPAGSPDPEVQVTWHAEDLADQTGLIDFGNVEFGTVAERTIKVRNVGTADLILQPATVPTGFTLLSNFSAGQVIHPGEFAVLTIQLNTSVVADRNGILSFGTNDTDEGPFELQLNASVNTPLLYLTALGPTSLNESDTGFVDVIVTRTYVSDISQSIVVNLSSDNPGAIQTFYGVWIEAGETSAITRIYLTNDGEIDTTQVALVKPVKTGFGSLGVSYTVANDDTVDHRTLGGYLSGTIPADTYQVLQQLIVAEGETLTLSPGTILRFDSGTGISVSGKLLAQGTVAAPITFTSSNPAPAPGDWNGIRLNSDTQQAILDYVDVSFAVTGIRVYGGGFGGVGTATIRHSNIHDNQFGIDVEGYASSAYATILDNQIHHNVTVGINVYSEGELSPPSHNGYASVTIERNEIRDNGIGVDVSAEGRAEFYGTGV